MKKLSLAIIGAALTSLGAMNTVQAAPTSGKIDEEVLSPNTISLIEPNLSQAPTLTLGTLWYEFSFYQVGEAARGCYPVDPTSSQYCDSSSDGKSVLLGTPDWQFTAPVTGAVLKVTDAFKSGDAFQIFDFGNLVGSTSLPSLEGNCGNNPEACFQDPLSSHGIFDLAGGNHSISIVPIASPYGAGAGYFQIAQAAPIGEPTSIFSILTFTTFATGYVLKRKRKNWGVESEI